ncbi:MAG: CoA pyrophosphatase [Clostridiales bacterium]|nr:CoA pyrophosphatase [Clostridiales bacterium]
MKHDLNFLRQHKATVIGLPESRKAAVCIPLLETADGYDILFEVRSASVASQPGDICLPGGSVEEGETTREAALREMCEELLVRPGQMEVLGLMDLFGGGTGRLYVYPYAVILKEYEGTFSTDEVAQVFSVPLDFFLNTEPEIYHTSMKVIPEAGFPFERIHGGREYGWRERREEILFYQYGEYTIWGMTAKIVHAFSRLFYVESVGADAEFVL